MKFKLSSKRPLCERVEKKERERETKRARIIRCILMGFVNQKATEVSEHGELGFFLDRTDWDEEDEDNVT